MKWADAVELLGYVENAVFIFCITVTTASFGTWRSPITSDSIVSSSIGLGGVAVDGEGLYWLESRPSEGGRTVLVQYQADGTVQDLTPPPFNVRTRVHEYGGAAFLVAQGLIYFVNFADQRLYRQQPGQAPIALTPENSRRYTDMVLDAQRDRLICVCENHAQTGQEPTNTIATIDLQTGAVADWVTGSDFYSSPRLSPDGTQLAWLDWQHPQMPWDGTQLWVASVQADGRLGESHCVAGSDSESVCAPLWSPDGRLYFVSDRSNWWNLYRVQGEETVAVYEMAAEFGFPHWVFGIQPYRFLDEQHLLCVYSQHGTEQLARLDLQAKTLETIPLPFTSLGALSLQGHHAYFIGGSPTAPTQLVQLDLKTQQTVTLKSASSLTIDPSYLSVPEVIAFPTENGQTAHAWFYPPQNPDFDSPASEKPPLRVKSHGGPTAAASATLDLRIQYWTSRGFAVVDVNYGGSTGYGRDYRQRLQGNWGIVDVADCANVAQYLANQGRVDGERLAIAGSSAGGYTTLAALTFTDVFKAGASYYGVSDLEALAQDTHKFEARYLDGLIGRYPEEQAIYQARSPIHHTDQLNCPVIFLQGLQDKVVPPNQAEMMVDVLKAKGLPVAYLTFAEEQHGFRRAETIKQALDAEFYFYSQVFGFEPAVALTPIEIFNLSVAHNTAE